MGTSNGRTRRLGWQLLFLLTLLPAGAGADEGDDGDSGLPPLYVHGFVSPGFILSTGNNYLGHSKRGSFEFTEVGLNFTVPLTEQLRAGMQLFARDLGRLGNYSPTFDWFYLDYHFADWLGLRAGRTKLPFGLYNEVNDVDAGRVPILLPQSVYPIESRDFLLALTGAELYGRVDLCGAGALEYRLYGGTLFLDLPNQVGSPIVVTDLDVPYVAGGRLLWETPLEGLRVGGSLQALELDLSVLAPAAAPFSLDLQAILWMLSAEYTNEQLLVAAEYSRWIAEIDSSDETLDLDGNGTPEFPDSRVVSERMYLMASLRVTDWLQPGVYWSLLFPNIRDRDGRAGRQHDVAATVRLDINPHWLLKVEGHLMHGTAALAGTTYNGATPAADLTKTWGVLLLKTTVYF